MAAKKKPSKKAGNSVGKPAPTKKMTKGMKPSRSQKGAAAAIKSASKRQNY